MKQLIKHRLKKIGLPPGTLVHVGEKKCKEIKITLFDYDEVHCEEKEIKNVDECYPFKDKPTITWIDVEGLHQIDILEKLGNFFGVHPLAQEDILNTEQRPKSEDFINNIYIVFKMLSYDNLKHEIVSEQVSLILGSNFLISFQEGIEGDIFDSIRGRIRGNKGRIRKSGSDYLAYRLLDAVVDNYFIILEKLGNKIELLEEELINDVKPKTLVEIHGLKKEMIFLRKSVWPLREVVNNLEKEDSPLIQESTKIFLRDVYDHTIQVMDTIEAYRDMIAGMLEIYLTNITNRTNTVMKVLTIFATIFMPPTFLVGIYGMNFKYMPELDWKWGYPTVMLLILLIALSMLLYFKKKKWI